MTETPWGAPPPGARVPAQGPVYGPVQGPVYGPVQGPMPAPRPGLADALVALWPDAGRPLRRTPAALALAAGTLGAIGMVAVAPGIGLVLTAFLLALVPATQAPERLRSAHEAVFGGLALALVAVVAVRDSRWLVTLCLLAAFGCGSLALARGTSWLGSLAAALVVPVGALRGLPWLARAARPLAPTDLRRHTALARGTGAGLLLAALFAALFASADPAFGRLLGSAVPELEVGDTPLRLIVLAVVTGLALVTAFVATAPPRLAGVAMPPGRAAKRGEWAVPLVLVNAVFAAFVAVQAAALFGGRDYVARTAGLTYAEYARRGFGQLLAVTLLTLLVVAVAARHAPRATRTDRTLVRALLGTLCLLAILVGASALHRLDLYEQAFGATQARLLAGTIEIWLIVVLGLVLAAGVRWSARWLPRAVLGSAAVALVLLAAVDADGLVARRNVDRHAATGMLDVDYVASLSADAVPALDRLPEPVRSCALSRHAERLSESSGGWGGANLARARAREILTARPATACAYPPRRGDRRS